MIAQASDQFTHHDHDAVKQGSGRQSHRHRRRGKSHSSGHCTPVNNPTQNGKDQEQRRASCKATANPSTKGKYTVLVIVYYSLPSVIFLRKSQLREEYAELTTSVAFAKALFVIYYHSQSAE